MKSLIILTLLFIQTSPMAESWDDISRLNKEYVQKVMSIKTEADVLRVLQNLNTGNKIVISGTRHSQGGHIVYPNAIVLDMKGFNKVISVSKKNKTVVVQSGATWSTIQKEVNRHSLSIKIMQSSNIFSVGGSLSANIHGRDPTYGPIIESIKSLKIALASGEVVIASRNKMKDLFYSTIGGYGLLGVILEAEIELTDNTKLIKTTVRTDYKEYPKKLLSELDKISLHFGRCSFVKDQTFLRECYSTNFHVKDPIPVVSTLKKEENTEINSLVFNYSRKSEVGKKLRWKLQKELLDVPGEVKLIDRNNAMRPPIKFLKYKNQKDTDILQEYFVPVDHFSKFMDELRDELQQADVNILSITLRYLKKIRIAS